jgi:acyl-CoA dehydrogenase
VLKVQATRTMENCAREACQILGGARFMRGCWVERIYHDVRVMAIGGGFEEIMFDLAGRQMAF